MKKRTCFLLTLGLLHMTGYLIGNQTLKGFAAATGASPAPKVFCSANGLETFTSKFTLLWQDLEGCEHEFVIDSKSASKLAGPYNRRNVYGAALAYGPILPRTMTDPILSYAFTGNAPLLTELGIDANQINGRISIRIEPKNTSDMQTFTFEVEP